MNDDDGEERFTEWWPYEMAGARSGAPRRRRGLRRALDWIRRAWRR